MLLLDSSLIQADMRILHQFSATLYTGCQSNRGLIPRLPCWPFTASAARARLLPFAAIPATRTSLQAADRGDLLVPSTETNIGGRSFRVAAPTIWNSLPLHRHNKAISERQFKLGLKTHLFNLAYKRHSSFENYWRVNLLTYLLTYLDIHI